MTPDDETAVDDTPGNGADNQAAGGDEAAEPKSAQELMDDAELARMEVEEGKAELEAERQKLAEEQAAFAEQRDQMSAINDQMAEMQQSLKTQQEANTEQLNAVVLENQRLKAEKVAQRQQMDKAAADQITANMPKTMDQRVEAQRRKALLVNQNIASAKTLAETMKAQGWSKLLTSTGNGASWCRSMKDPATGSYVNAYANSKGEFIEDLDPYEVPDSVEAGRKPEDTIAKV